MSKYNRTETDSQIQRTGGCQREEGGGMGEKGEGD